MELRYYADADVREWHNHAIRCLRSLQEEYDIAVEINRIDQQHGQLPDFPIPFANQIQNRCMSATSNGTGRSMSELNSTD